MVTLHWQISTVAGSVLDYPAVPTYEQHRSGRAERFVGRTAIILKQNPKPSQLAFPVTKAAIYRGRSKMCEVGAGADFISGLSILNGRS